MAYAELLLSDHHLSWEPHSAKEVHEHLFHLIKDNEQVDALRFLQHVLFHTEFSTKAVKVKNLLFKQVWKRIFTFHQEHFTELINHEMCEICSAGINAQLHQGPKIATDAVKFGEVNMDEIIDNLLNIGRLNGIVECICQTEGGLSEESLKDIIATFGG